MTKSQIQTPKFYILTPKFLTTITLLLLIACNGTLTDNQKKKIKSEMENSKIKRLSDADITEASFAYGRTISKIIERRDPTLANKTLVDSLSKAFSVHIKSLEPGNSNLLPLEKEIIEAYRAGSGSFELSDNIQKLSADSLLYTKPLVKERPDGSSEFYKALGIRMARKQIILSIKD